MPTVMQDYVASNTPDQAYVTQPYSNLVPFKQQKSKHIRAMNFLGWI